MPSRPKPVYTSATGQAVAGAGRETTSVAARVVLEAAGRLEEFEREREVVKEGGKGGGGGGGRGGTWAAGAGAGTGSGAYDASRDPRLRR